MMAIASENVKISEESKFRKYSVLDISLLQPGVGFSEPQQNPVRHVGFEDPAESVMTHLKQVNVVVIHPEDSLVEANQRMIQRGVRLLLVVDANRKVAGLITATDILGEKPIQFIAMSGGRREDIRVQDIMTPQHRLEVLRMDDVHNAKVGNVVATLKYSGRQHALVVENLRGNQQVICGLFSATQIARQLGAAIHIGELARTFAEIEALLAH